MDEGTAARRRGPALAFSGAAALAVVAALGVLTTSGGSGAWVIVPAIGAAILLVVGLLWAWTGAWLPVELPAFAGGLIALGGAPATGGLPGAWAASPALWVGVAVSLAVAILSKRLRQRGPLRVLGAIMLGAAAVWGVALQLVFLFLIRVALVPWGP